MPRVTERYKDDQRADILAAARRCFVRNGFHCTSMQDVFVEAGKSAGAVYRYFPKKDDMIVGVAMQNLDDVTDMLRAALTSTDDDQTVGEMMAELLEAVLQRHRDEQLACMALIVWAEALRNPALAERLEAAVVGMTHNLAAVIRDRQGTGTLTGASADTLAPVILAILPGFLLNLTVLGPDRAAEMPDAIRALWKA